MPIRLLRVTAQWTELGVADPQQSQSGEGLLS